MKYMNKTLGHVSQLANPVRFTQWTECWNRDCKVPGSMPDAFKNPPGTLRYTCS